MTATPIDSPPRSSCWPQAVGWGAAIALAFALDSTVATWLKESGTAQVVKDAAFWRLVKHGGLFHYVTIPTAILLGIFHPLRWRAAIFELCCGTFAVLASVTKWIAGRFRPFKLPPYDRAQPFHLIPFDGGLHGFVHPPSDLSFVSGHTALAFATATGLAVLVWSTRARGWVYIGYAIALLVSMERVGENAHWLSDATCAAAMSHCAVRWFAKAVNVGWKSDASRGV